MNTNTLEKCYEELRGIVGKNIESFIKQNFVYCTLFKGKDRVDIIDRKEFKDNLLTNYY